MATHVDYYCNAASTGGDGTTNALSGSTAAFNDLDVGIATVYANYSNDFAAADVQPTIHLEGTGAFGGVTESTVLTTSATCFLEITCTGSARHAGTWDTNKPRVSAAIGAGAVRLGNMGHLRLRGLQIENTGTGGLSSVGGLAITANGTNIDIRVEECLVRTTGSPASLGTLISVASGTSGTAYVANCIAWREGSVGSIGISMSGTGPSFRCYSCTVRDCATGINKSVANGVAHAKNVLIDNVSGNAVGNGANWDSIDYCATSNADFGTSVPSPTNSRVSQTFTYVNGAGFDFHLAAGDAGAKGFGTDLSSDPDFPITVDIDGVTRTGTWDIGADQVTTGGGGGGGSGAYYIARRRRR